MEVSKLVVHHSASPRDTTTKSKIESWHKERDFNQIGYHKVIEANGAIVAGRSESIMGAHAKGANSGSLGVCVVGNFETESPNESQINSLVDLLTHWCKTYGLAQTAIYGHCNVPGGTTATACPGKNLKSRLNAIQQLVKQRLMPNLYAIEARIKDASVRSAVHKALIGDGRISYDEVKMIIRSSLDGRGTTRQELLDLQMILQQSKSLDFRSKQLIEQFVRNPSSVKHLL